MPDRATSPDVVDAARAHGPLTPAGAALLNEAWDLAQAAHRDELGASPGDGSHAGRGRAGGDGAAGRLLRRAVRMLPAAERSRYAEEWAADLAATDGVVARLRLTIGMAYSARVLRRDHLSARCPYPRPR